MEYQIKNIEPEDMHDIQKLIESCGPYVAAYNIYAYWMLAEYNNSTCFAAFENEKIIGVITAIQSIEKNMAFIWQICIDENHRGKNVAYNLINELAASCKKQNIPTIELSITDTNEASQNLFAKFAKENNLELKHVKDEIIGNSTDKIFQMKLY